jgi:CheY-like chemotaxis protein
MVYDPEQAARDAWWTKEDQERMVAVLQAIDWPAVAWPPAQTERMQRALEALEASSVAQQQVPEHLETLAHAIIGVVHEALEGLGPMVATAVEGVASMVQQGTQALERHADLLLGDLIMQRAAMNQKMVDDLGYWLPAPEKWSGMDKGQREHRIARLQDAWAKVRLFDVSYPMVRAAALERGHGDHWIAQADIDLVVACLRRQEFPPTALLRLQEWKLAGPVEARAEG